MRACLKNRSRRGEEADQGAILARNPPLPPCGIGGYATRSGTARERLLSVAGEPLFIADWERVLMLHYEVEPEALQRVVPFELDLRAGRAFISAVAFTMRGMRPRVGGRFAAWLLKPIATHEFLNVRTYVRHRGEFGIYFLAEWLPNRLSVALGPRLFGLPYRSGRFHYQHHWEEGLLAGSVTDTEGRGTFAYRGEAGRKTRLAACEPGGLEEWLMERYTAFTYSAGKARFFRVWHSPWPQVRVNAEITERRLLDQSWLLFREARMIGANFSPGVHNVWMGRAHRVR